MDFINLKSQYAAYKADIDAQIKEVLESSTYIMGSKITQLESTLSNYTGAKHARVCSSGTSALILALMGIGIKGGDEVITSPFTFIATAEAICLLGAKPVFADIDEHTYNIDYNLLESLITPRTKAIIPVSIFGQCAEMDEINVIAKKHSLFVIEDACQSFGAEYRGVKSCNLSTIGVTSFFPSKPLGCYGDGGAVFTNDDALDAKIASLLNHGQSERYKHRYIGFNGRLDAIQCGVLLAKLAHFNEELEIRQKLVKRYNEGLQGYHLPYIQPHNKSAYAQYSIRAQNKSRNEVLDFLSSKNIPSAVYYPIPLHLQESMNHLGYRKGDFRVTERICEEIFSIPFSAFLNVKDQDFIINTLNGIGK